MKAKSTTKKEVPLLSKHKQLRSGREGAGQQVWECHADGGLPSAVWMDGGTMRMRRSGGAEGKIVDE